MTSPSGPSGPSGSAAATPTRPTGAADAALFDAVTVEHGVIYGYGVVSAHSAPDVNDVVSDAMTEHRRRREAAIATLAARQVAAPLPAVGYALPIQVDDPAGAAQLAVRMEEDCAVAWRAVLERADADGNRSFAVTALTEATVTAAKWRVVAGMQPSTVAFPGGKE